MLEQLMRWVSEQTNISDETLMKCCIFMLGVVSKWGLGKLKALVWKGSTPSSDASTIKAAINRPEVLVCRGSLSPDCWNIDEGKDKTFFPRKVLGSFRRLPTSLNMERPFDPQDPSKGKLKIYLEGNWKGDIYVGSDEYEDFFSKKDRQEIMRDAWLAYFRCKERDQEQRRIKKRANLGLPT
jgi:hypothetical protein